MTPQELRQKREAAHLSQQELAEKVGWSGPLARQRVYDYESGRRNMPPAVQTAFRLVLAALE